MTCDEKREVKRELELATLMVKDLQRLWSSYAKRALIAKQERELKQDKKGFLEYETEAELIEAWGGAYIDEDTYRHGLEYFESIKRPPSLSVIEEHRRNIQTLLNRWKGTVETLTEELNPKENIPKESIFDKMAREERQERYRSMM